MIKMESLAKGHWIFSRFLSMIVIIFATINSVWCDDEVSTSPVVDVVQGTLRGVNLLTRSNREIFGFLGVPYAQPPVGNLRFASPVAAEYWDGVLNATQDSNMCPQTDYLTGNFQGDEDCLYLNIYTPELPSSGTNISLPVMVWIYGGSFMLGSGNSANYGPGYLLDNSDVILVVPNYRVGALGFLSTGDEVSPGNYGLKDLVLSLEWIQENIECFGGDPNRVTVFGQSSGAAAAQLLALSDSANYLFERYITQSGSALAFWAYRPSSSYAERAFKFGEDLGCSTTDSTSLLECLRGLDASKIVDATLNLFVWQGYPEVIWGPTDEPDIEGAFITDNPMSLLAVGKASDKEWMSGVTRDEGLSTSAAFYDFPTLFTEFLANETLLPYVMEYYDRVDDVTNLTETLKAHYLADLTANTSVLLSDTTNLLSDGFMVYPQWNAIQLQDGLDYCSPYVYTFAYRGTFSYSYYWSGGDPQDFGVTHGDDVIYLFPEADSIFAVLGKEMSSNDLEMVDAMVQLWTTFAATGIPDTTGLTGDAAWEPYDLYLENYLRIGSNSDLSLEVNYAFHGNDMEFWNDLDC